MTTILILNKRVSPFLINDREKTKFITINATLQEIGDNQRIDELYENIITDTPDKAIGIQTYSSIDLFSFQLSWAALFVDISWLSDISEKLVPADSLFIINRGERRGQDKMFYPETGHGIEPEFIEPVLKTPKEIPMLIARAESEAFCCSLSLL